MNNQEPQSRVKRYDFNKGSKQPNQTPKNFKVWPWILGLVIVIGLLVGGIKTFTADQNHHQQTTQSSSMMSSSSSHNSNQQTSSSKHSNSSSTKSNPNSSKTTKKPTSSNNEHPNQPNTQSENPANQPAAGGSFSNPRQFSSVADANSWAKATQSSWLKAGYNNYTITSDGQGYYVLNFTR